MGSQDHFNAGLFLDFFDNSFTIQADDHRISFQAATELAGLAVEPTRHREHPMRTSSLALLQPTMNSFSLGFSIGLTQAVPADS
jgi:hypothetical protein